MKFKKRYNEIIKTLNIVVKIIFLLLGIILAFAKERLASTS